MAAKAFCPYGQWPSPFSAGMLSRRLRINDVQWGRDGRSLVWVEGRAGQGVLVQRASDGVSRDLTLEQNVKGGLAYGGGEFTIAGSQVYFSERSGRLYRMALDKGLPKAITPSYGSTASPAVSPDGRWVIYCFSDGRNDVLALVDAEGRDWPVKLVQGADFYMSPAWHLSGQKIAWLEWNQPDMPWQSTRLNLGTLQGTPPHLCQSSVIAGEPGQVYTQPEFSPDGRWLSYIATKGEWEVLILFDLATGEQHELLGGEGLILSTPAWIYGLRFYGWSPTSQRIFYTRFEQGKATLWAVELAIGFSKSIDTAPYTWIEQIAVSPTADEIAFIGSAPAIPKRVVQWNGNTLQVAAALDAERVEGEYFSYPQQLNWHNETGETIYGLYYPPTHPGVKSPGLPPAIVHIHGGPTTQAWMAYDAEVQYFTSRGYAWLELNYRGSTGYGRTYQEALGGQWGVFDVEDAVSAAHMLKERGLADSGRLIIHGSSAGGFTVLNTLSRYPKVYKAGICLYGVTNLYTLAMETFKFEASYTDWLTGALPEAAEAYYARSPLFHAAQIQNALAIFHGKDDPVVPLSQSEEIVQVLRQNNIPHLFQVYEGEGHSFRKPETILDYLSKVERFLYQNVLYAP